MKKSVLITCLGAIALLFSTVFVVSSCSKESDSSSGIVDDDEDDDNSSSRPSYKKPEITFMMATSDYDEVNVLYEVDSESEVTDCGVYFGTSPNNINKKHPRFLERGKYIRTGYACGPGKTVYFKAYATNAAGTTITKVSSYKTKNI